MITEAPLFGLGLQGKSPNVTANSLTNAYYEFSAQKDRTSVAIYGTPGLELFADKGDTPWRGLRVFGDYIYGVHRGTFYSINNAGTITSIGTLGTTSGRVDMTDDGTYIVMVDGSEIYTYNTSTTTFAAVSDADRPASPNTCIFQAGRILTDEDGTGQFKGGDLYDPTAWNPLDFATAESDPDNLVRIINYRGTVVLFGETTTEFWSNIGGSGFPYQRILQADVEYGLSARWSVAPFAGTYAYLAKNREGQVMVAVLNGYNTPERISNPDLEYLINNYTSVSDATAYSYMLGGHPMYQLNFPTDGKSWLYDATTKYWSQLTYDNNERHRGEIAVDFINQTIVSDYSNGKLYKLTPNTYTDNGVTIQTILKGRHLYNQKKKLRFTRLELGYEPATTTDQTATPVAGLRISKDGGHSWGTQTFAELGKVGEYKNRCKWPRLGSGRDMVAEITIAEPIKKVITDCTLILEDGLS